MIKKIYILLVLLFASTNAVKEDPLLSNKKILTGLAKEKAPDTLTSYDQRQTGKYNVHFNIKDVQLFSVRGDEFNTGVDDDSFDNYEDYDYDVSHFTINPILAMLGADSSYSTTKTTTTTAKTPTQGAFLNLPEKEETQSAVVEITSKPIVTVSKPESDNKQETTTKAVVDELTTEYEKIPFEALMDPILRQLLRSNQKHNRKAPFRLKAVYKRPHKYRNAPRRVINEFVIEGVPNRLTEEEVANAQEPLHFGIGLPDRPNLPNANNFLQQQSDEPTTRRPRRTRRPVDEPSCFDGEFLDDYGRCIKLKPEKSEL